MTFSSLLYQLLIGPIQILFEVIYGFAFNVLSNYGLAIIVLSLAMNFMLMPLYKRADAIQDEEREAEKRMKPFVAHLKKTFKGDERFMMLQTYYRQNNYKPFYVLKGFLSLALEVPFFIAAYNFLSGYAPLYGASFGPIANLGVPDQMITVAGHSINVLPILMTVINIVSSTIYTKGSSLRDKIQLYGIALIFLVLLYNSPAGLVLYWTLNNLFSLVRNFLTRTEKAKKCIRPLLSFAGAALLVYGIFLLSPEVSVKHRIVIILAALLLQVPLVFSFFRKKHPPHARRKAPLGIPDSRAFFVGCLLLTVLTGLLIPSAVIVSSPQEFVNVTHYYSPLRHVLYSLLLAAGAFLIWFNVFYHMSGEKGKHRFGLVILILCLVFLVNYMFFGTDLGRISSELHFDENPFDMNSDNKFTTAIQLLNLGIVAVLIATTMFIYSKWRKAVLPMLTVITLALAGMSGVNLVKIRSSEGEITELLASSTEETATFNLSRNGKNVVFIMLDCAIDSYFPYCIEEKPELKDQFAGFTWYSNALSFGPHTLFTSAALYGGYEYRAYVMNERGKATGEKLVDMQNEALKVVPHLFLEAGYEVTVCDPPYAGFQWIPDLSIFDDYPEINTYNTNQGQFNPEVQEIKDQIWKRNFFVYSLMKCAPVIAQPNLYVNGDYYSNIKECGEFDLAYAVLKALPSITNITDSDQDTFMSMCNYTTHDPVVLSMPDYVPSDRIDNTAYDLEHAIRSAPGMPDISLVTNIQITHYHVDMAAFLQLGKWFDWLREQGVWDNTRIILAADHGYRQHHSDGWIFDPQLLAGDASMYNPLLLVKDFGDTELKRNDTFVTNADVPAWLMKDLIENPVNPFTGKPITDTVKNEEEMIVSTSYDWELEKVLDSSTFLPGTWYSVHDKVLTDATWTKLGRW